MSQITGSKSSISTTPLQLIAASTRINAQVVISADSGNSASVYIGFSSTQTPGTADATDGFPLAAGASITLSPAQVSNDLSNVYIVAPSGSQKVHYIGA